MRIERRAEREIRKALEDQLKAATANLANEAGAVIQAEAGLGVSSDSLLDVLRRMLLESVTGGVLTATGQLETLGLGIDWTLVNEAARQWVLGPNPDRVLGGKLRELFDQISLTSQRTLRQEVAGWIGSGEKLPDLVKRLEPTFGQQRAQLIASTEVTRAYAEGNTLAYAESGVVEKREWRTAADERVCPICGPLHKTQAALGQSFEGVDNPPAHPRCRCWVVPVVDIPKQEPITAPKERKLSPKNQFTPEYFGRTKEHEAIVKAAEEVREFDEAIANQMINESLDQVRFEEDISSAARAFGYVPGRMKPEDWLALSDDLEKETGRLLKFSTEARRAGAGEKLRGPATTVAQVGGKDQLIKDGAISARDARRISADLNRETKDRAAVYLESRLLRLGYKADDLAELSDNQASRLEQVRRLLAEVGHRKKQRGRIDNVPDTARGRIIDGASDKQTLEALSAARQPRTAEGLDMWELYKESTIRAGLNDPPYIPDELWGDDDESTPSYVLG